MVCPECKAEYREGFTKCADCDVDLVASLVEASRSKHEEALAETGEYEVLLWKGTGPHLYMSILQYLENCGIRRLGRSTNAPLPNQYQDRPYESFETPEFGVWVSENDKFMAKWVVDSILEERAVDEAMLKDAQTEPSGRDETLPKTGVVCVLCSSEFPDGVSLCPNCEIPLRPARDLVSIDEHIRSLSRLPHPDFTAALRAELGKANIPFNDSVGVKSFLVTRGSVAYKTRHKVDVLEADFERATKVLARVLQPWEFETAVGFQGKEDPRKLFWPKRAEKNRWSKDDLSAEVWSGKSLFTLLGNKAVLREHNIPHSVEVSPAHDAKLFVHPEDFEVARELVTATLEEIFPGGKNVDVDQEHGN